MGFFVPEIELAIKETDPKLNIQAHTPGVRARHDKQS
jgi:hypothetical protein